MVDRMRVPREAVRSAPAGSGKYTLLEQIGEGGMARIYLARAHGIGGFERLVVVKQVLPHLAKDAEFVARFFQEARLAATLHHPNIVAVYDIDEQAGSYFYAMEYVPGFDLREVLLRASEVSRRLSLDEIVAVITGLCAGLHHAHTRTDEDGLPLGIVHRDVSPSNVLLSFEGAVKLSDFGVAKARTGMVSTVAGRLRGKIPYMSPEQCAGEALDRRSDVYAVGVLLWELLAGRRLHTGESEIAILRRIADRDAPSISTVRPDCPRELARIVEKALARSPASRYQSADALQSSLEDFGTARGLKASSRAIAGLLAELFGDDASRERAAAIDLLETRRIGDPGGQTPATGTLAPIAVAAREDEDRSATHEVAIQPGVRRWRGLALGLVLGGALGVGGLYLASPSAAPTAAAAPVLKTPPPAGPSAPPAEPVAAEPVAAEPPAAEPPAAEAAEAAAAADPPPDAEAPARTGRNKNERRGRKTKRQRADGTTPSIDLESALPPGYKGK